LQRKKKKKKKNFIVTVENAHTIEKKFNLAEEHLIMGTDHSAELSGKMAYEWAKQEDSQWKGVFLARAVLQ
jgi:hypothetical protein